MRKDVEGILSLTGDDFRNVVLNNAGSLSYEVKDLPDEARQRLIEVVEGAWPESGVRANVERDENQIRFHDRGAHAWLTLAPALDVAPTPEQWADLATSGALMTDSSNWLSRHYTQEATLLAARSCDSSGTRPWAELVGSIPSDVRTPDELIEAIVTHLREPTVPEPDFELWQIGDRFVREERLEALQALSRKNEELERRLRPWRARLGETEAARVLLEELTAALGQARAPTESKHSGSTVTKRNGSTASAIPRSCHSSSRHSPLPLHTRASRPSASRARSAEQSTASAETTPCGCTTS